MEIKYLGHSAFFIKTKSFVGKQEARIVTDPYNPKMVGLKFPKTEADIVTISHQHEDHNQAKIIDANPLVIDLPGEFEKNQVRVFGFLSYHDKKKGEERGENILFKIQAEGLNLLHCGDIGIVPDDNFIEQIGTIDILFVPVGGFYTIDASEASELVSKIEPSIIIPMHYGHAKLSSAFKERLAPLGEFLKKMDAQETQPIPKLVVKKEELGEEIKVVVLEI